MRMHRHWSDADIVELRKLAASGQTAQDIAKTVSRTMSAIQSMAYKLKIKIVSPKVEVPWTEEEKAKLKEMRNAGLSYLTISKHFGRSRQSAIGVGFRSVQKAINAVIGGAVGGFVGGGVFNIIYEATASGDDTGTVSRLIGFAVVGALIGVGIGLADAVRKNLWLQIATGGMAGKQFIVYQQNAVLGSSPAADITLIKDPEIAGMHVRLNQRAGGTGFEVLPGASDVLLNGEQTRSGKLSDGALLQVGGTVLQFGEKNVEMPTIA